MKKIVLLMVITLIFSGCFTYVTGPVTGRQYSNYHWWPLKQFDSPYYREVYVSEHPELEEWERQNILNGKVYIGMKADAITPTIGYEPTDITRSTYATGVHEQWIYQRSYAHNQYVYVENGVVTSVHE